jgi:hypothetical protein
MSGHVTAVCRSASRSMRKPNREEIRLAPGQAALLPDVTGATGAPVAARRAERPTSWAARRRA